MQLMFHCLSSAVLNAELGSGSITDSLCIWGGNDVRLELSMAEIRNVNAIAHTQQSRAQELWESEGGHPGH